MRRSSVPPDSPRLHWPALTFYPESSYRPLLSRVAWFVQDRGCGGAAAGTLTVLALIEALGGGFDNDFAENSCLQWWGGRGGEEAGAALNEFVNEGSKIRWPFRSLFSWYVTLWTLCWYLLDFCVFFSLWILWMKHGVWQDTVKRFVWLLWQIYMVFSFCSAVLVDIYSLSCEKLFSHLTNARETPSAFCSRTLTS